MKGKILKKVIAAALVLTLVSGGMPISPVSDMFGGAVITANAETAADLTISSIADWSTFAANVKNGTDYSGKLVVLGADLDFSGTTFTTAYFAGDASHPFRGTFDGQGHTIKNVNYSSRQAYNDDWEYSGMIVKNNGCIKNTIFDNCEIWGGKYAAIVSAYNNGGIIENCTISGVPGALNTFSYAAAVTVNNYNGTVRNCFANVRVHSNNGSGIIVSKPVSGMGTVENTCYTADSTTRGTNWSLKNRVDGGVGTPIYKLTAGTNVTSVTPTSEPTKAFGETKYYTAGTSVAFTVEFADSTKNYSVSCGSNLASYSNGSYTVIIPDEADAKVNATELDETYYDLANGTIEGVNAVYPRELSAIKPEPVVRDKAGVLLTKDTDYTVEYSGGDFLSNGTYTVTVKGTGKYNGTVPVTYQIVSYETMGGQNIGFDFDDSGKYYMITSEADLRALASYTNGGGSTSGKVFRQTENITLTGGFTPIGNGSWHYFQGTYDGADHTISGLNISGRVEYAGLFGYILNGTVNNVILVSPNVSSTYQSGSYGSDVGALVGYLSDGSNRSSVKDCFVIDPTLAATGSGTNYVGVFIGEWSSFNSIENCFYYDSNAEHNYPLIRNNLFTQSTTITNTERVYTITADGCTAAAEPTYTFDGTKYYKKNTEVTLSDYNAPATGYHFDCYKANGTAIDGSTYNLSAADSVFTPTYAPNNYTVTYNANGGEGNMDAQSFTYDEAAKVLTANAFTRTGYHFVGWAESEDGDVVYTDEQAVRNLTAEENGIVTLYAKWAANTYTVHFDPVIPVNGEMADQTFDYDEAKALTKNNFSTTTGEWLSWNTEPDGTGTSYTDEQLVQNLTEENGAVITLYAQWHLMHRFNYDNKIFNCHLADNANEVYWAYPGKTVKVDVIDSSSIHTITVTGDDGTEIVFDTTTNTFTMPDQEVYITSTSVKKMAYTTILLDNFKSWEDVAYLYDENTPTVTPTVTVMDGDTTLTEGTDYTVSITNNTGSPDRMVTATVTITGIGDYVGTNAKEFRITPFNIENCEIRGTLEIIDDGYGCLYPLMDKVQVWNGDVRLKGETVNDSSNVDFTVEIIYPDSYNSTFEPGTYTAYVVGKGNWYGRKEFSFTVIEPYHTVVFDANGGTGEIASDTATKGQHYYLPECTFTPQYGYEFDYWKVYYDNIEEDPIKQPGDYFTAPYIWSESYVQTITVTAHWKEKAKYSVTLPECVELVSGIVDNEGKAYTGEVITFGVKDGYYVRSVSLGDTTLQPDESGIYTVTVNGADITVTAQVSPIIDLSELTNDYIAQDGVVLTGETGCTVTIADGASIILKDADIYGGIVCAGTATITLIGSNSVSVDSWVHKAGIEIGGENTTLTIKGDGSLTATGGNMSAGIGLSSAWKPEGDVIGGDIVIKGGTITAYGGRQWGAGIGTGVIYGGGNAKTVRIGNITIKGGSVTAYGGEDADGIGTGFTYYLCTNEIGTVTVYDDAELVDASSIKNFNNVVYMHGYDDVTANKTEYFTIGEDGDRRIIAQKDNTDYTITIDNNIAHGTVTANSTAKYGETVTLTVTPDNGYRLLTITVTDANGSNITVSGNSFMMPKGSVTVTASFVKSTAVLNTSTGVLTLSGNVDADEVKAYQGNGFEIESPVISVVCESGTVLPEDCSRLFYMFDNVKTIDLSNADISGVLNMYGMFSSCPQLTTIYVSSSWNMENVEYSEEMFGYCDNLTGGNGTKWIDQDHSTPEASSGTYAVIDGQDGQQGYLTGKYSNLTIDNAENGTVSADKTGSVLIGDTVTLTVTPDTGYVVKSVSVNGAAIEAVNGVYSFTMPDGDVTVSAEFAKPITPAMVTLSETSFTYDGTEKTVTVTVTDGDKTLVEGTDYTVTDNTKIDAGRYFVHIEGIGAYTGGYFAEWRINAECTVTYTINDNSTTEKIAYGAPFTVIAPQNDTTPFKCWMDGEKIVSYAPTYGFIVHKDMNLTAVYNNETVEDKYILTMSASKTQYNGNNAVRFIFDRSIDYDAYTIEEVGIRYATNKLLGADIAMEGYSAAVDLTSGDGANYLNGSVDEALKNGTNVKNYKSTATQWNGTVDFSYSVGTHTDAYVYAIGYVKVRTADNEVKTLYSNVVATSYDIAAQ